MTRRRGAGKILAGTVNMSGISSGDGTVAVTFDNPFDEIPAVIAQVVEAITLTTATFGVWITGITSAGFTINLQSDCSETDLNFSWIAAERQSSERYTAPA